MAQLAGKDLTRQSIFLIETGKARPSARTLELIAARTGKPKEFFARSRGEPVRDSEWPVDSDLEQLQALCLQQQFDKAISLGRRMLQQPLRPELEAHVRQYVGQALVRSSQPDEALEHLRRAQALLDSDRDPWLAVECADWEASALYLKEDSRALSVAQHALKLCRQTKPRLPGQEARILEHIASIHVKNHTFDEAIRFYEQALETAGALRDLPRLGRTYHGLGIAYQERGDLVRAVEFTHKALALYALEHDKALLARGENELGMLLTKQGRFERADEALRAALDHFDEAGTEVAKSNVLLSIADLELRRGRIDDGIVAARRGIEMAGRLGEHLARSSGHELLAQLYERKGERRKADREFRIAMRMLDTNGFRERLAEIHASYAQLLEARRDARGARIHWKQAAELALHRGERPRQKASISAR